MSVGAVSTRYHLTSGLSHAHVTHYRGAARSVVEFEHPDDPMRANADAARLVAWAYDRNADVREDANAASGELVLDILVDQVHRGRVYFGEHDLDYVAEYFDIEFQRAKPDAGESSP
jgi:hypothetical protein